MLRSVGRVSAAIYLVVSLAVAWIVFFSSVALTEPSVADVPLFLVLALHFAWGVVLMIWSTAVSRFSRVGFQRLLFVPELLGAASLLLFLFSFIFALNANMDYVQRFIASGGNLRLALDTRTERLLVWVRVFPLVAVNLAYYLLIRLGRYSFVCHVLDDREAPDRVVRPWAFLLVLLAALLRTVAMPSFVSLEGLAPLGWIAYVPLFLVLRSSRFGHAYFYGIVFGVFSTLLTSYWLGTFNLVSLQITVLFFLIYYVIFTPAAVALYRVTPVARPLVFPLAFTLFEYLRSSGFLGYPWALAAHSQYAVLPLIQMTEVTGVWGLSFLVLFVNSAIAEFLGSLVQRRAATRFGGRARFTPVVRRSIGWLGAAGATVGVVALAGAVVLAVGAASDAETRSITVAQIQQNNDPRKSDYERTFQTLVSLTDAAMADDPDLVVWSETAFVPNIRRWSVDESVRRFHRLVTRFLDYQASLDTWLVTGNDDYEVILDEDGTEVERLNYNAAVLFDDAGERRETYRKIRLVPFTEHFPYREQFPRVYDLLLEFDVNFWEQGSELTVFEHPQLRFSTPICYEDVFPNYVRRLVRAGSEAILNISNDYWSLAEVQAKQHFVAGLFRAVENRRPVLRTTSSGLTGQIDRYGRIVQTAPYFEEAYLVSRLEIRTEQATTIYTRWGDYFPPAAGGILALLALLSLVPGIAARTVPRSWYLPRRPVRGRSGSPAAPSAVRDAGSGSGPVEAKPRGRAKLQRRGERRRLNWREIWDDE